MNLVKLLEIDQKVLLVDKILFFRQMLQHIINEDPWPSFINGCHSALLSYLLQDLQVNISLYLKSEPLENCHLNL